MRNMYLDCGYEEEKIMVQSTDKWHRVQESECKSQSARALAVKPGTTYLDPCPPCLRAAVHSGPKIGEIGNHQDGNNCCGSGAGSGGFVTD
jgi:hypothetical protein